MEKRQNSGAGRDYYPKHGRIAKRAASGKLKFTDDLEPVAAARGFTALPISLQHARAAGALPPHHRDPIDRMRVAQAMIENLKLITNNPRITLYPIRAIKTGA